MKKSLVLVAFFTMSQSAFAHLSYTGRAFGTFSGLENASATISNQAVSGNYAWADAADGNLGDSHKSKAFSFSLLNDAWVTFSVIANPSATASSVDGLIPGFSIYSGLAALTPFPAPQTSADYDTSAASLAWRSEWAQANTGPGSDFSATNGSWNAIGSWKIGGDGDPSGVESALTSFTYQGSVSSTTHSVTGTFFLSAGDYSIFVGGNDIANKSDVLNSVRNYGLSATLSVAAVPEPTSYALMLAGISFLAWQVRRSSKATAH